MEFLLSFLAALGAILLLWCLSVCLLSPLSARGMITVWHISGPCPELEFRVRCCLILQKFGFLSTKLLLVDCGLSPDARIRAEKLVRDEPLVDLVFQKDMVVYFEFIGLD